MHSTVNSLNVNFIIYHLDAVGSPPPADDEDELIVTGGIDDVVKIWKYRYSSGTAEKNGCFYEFH